MRRFYFLVPTFLAHGLVDVPRRWTTFARRPTFGRRTCLVLLWAIVLPWTMTTTQRYHGTTHALGVSPTTATTENQSSSPITTTSFHTSADFDADGQGTKQLAQVVQSSYTTLVTTTPQGRFHAIHNPESLAQHLSSVTPPVAAVHWIFLVHGWMGNPAEMNTLRTSLVQNAAASRKNAVWIVHCAEANDGKTSDGIAAGGTRLAQEMTTWIQQSATPTTTTTTSSSSSSSSSPTSTMNAHNTTLSIVGNSLGGLYARYALGKLSFGKNHHHHEHQVADDDDASETCTNNNKNGMLLHVTPVVFGTTATPHLGVGHQHTYLPLPRWVERGIAFALQQTGADLFRTSPVIDDMTLNDAFVSPLRQFQRRIAYANIHGTDFQVPTATAAFLTAEDTTPGTHHRVASSTNSDIGKETDMIRLIVQTNQTPWVPFASPASPQQLARALDSMGWEKVFVDVRNQVPAIPIPSIWTSSPSSTLTDSFSSADLYAMYTTWTDTTWHVPLGHTVMVANAKNALYARWNVGGKPVMNALSMMMIDTLNDTIRRKPT